MFPKHYYALILILLLLVVGAHAQVFRVQGGESTLLDAQGGTLEIKAPDYDGSLGFGFYQGRPEIGGNSRYKFRDYTILAGDENIPFTLPTDIFDASHYFSARGLGVTRKYDDSRFYAFAGATSTWMGTGLFSAASADRAAGIFFYERSFNRNLKFFSRNIVSNTQTSLQGFEWKAKPWLKAAVTGGTGSNHSYFASSLDAETTKLAFKTSYVLASERFQRVTIAAPFSSEVNKENVQMLYRPNSFASFTAGHENILEPISLGGPMQQASVNQLSSDFRIERFYFGTGLFSANAEGRKSSGENLYVGRRIGQRFEVNTNYFVSTPPAQPGLAPQKITILSGVIRENFSSRFSLLQLVSRTQGQTTFAFGGDFTSNRLQIRADYQNVYLPFRPTNPFEQALALNVIVRVKGPLQVSAASNVAPDGKLRYTFAASTYLYRLKGMASNAVSAESFSIARYVIQGIVKDDQDQPVEGAALHIGREIAYTDSSGRFQLRVSKRGPYAISVVPDEFLTNIVYEVDSAPAQARGEADDVASDLQIIVHHKIPAKNP